MMYFRLAFGRYSQFIRMIFTFHCDASFIIQLGVVARPHPALLGVCAWRISIRQSEKYRKSFVFRANDLWGGQKGSREGGRRANLTLRMQDTYSICLVSVAAISKHPIYQRKCICFDALHVRDAARCTVNRRRSTLDSFGHEMQQPREKRGISLLK